MRIRIDHDAVRVRQSLQSRREIRRLAHYTALLGFAGTDEIAYDDETCGNTNADRQSAAGRHPMVGASRKNFLEQAELSGAVDHQSF